MCSYNQYVGIVMYRYATLIGEGQINNIIVRDILVPDTPTCVNIDDSPWLQIGDMIDTPKPTPVTPKTTWQTNKELFDNYMDYLDKLQNRPLASIIVAQSNQQEPDATDIEKLAKYEERKKYLREKRDVLLSNSTQDLIALIDSYTEADVLANQKLAKTVA